jgi:hypothetical protein
MGLQPIRHGEEAHTKALKRLDEALDRQRDLAVRAEAAEGTSGEDRASDALARAHNEVAASEAWAVWTEREIRAVTRGR